MNQLLSSKTGLSECLFRQPGKRQQRDSEETAFRDFGRLPWIRLASRILSLGLSSLRLVSQTRSREGRKQTFGISSLSLKATCSSRKRAEGKDESESEGQNQNLGMTRHRLREKVTLHYPAPHSFVRFLHSLPSPLDACIS